MDAKDIETYKTRLEVERKNLVDELLKEETPEDFGSDAGHADEEGNEAESLGYQLAEAQITKNRINDIDAALNKIREGTYGICEKCGKEIEKKILDLIPESRFCRNCKKEQ